MLQEELVDDWKDLNFHPLAHQYVKVPCNAANGKKSSLYT